MIHIQIHINKIYIMYPMCNKTRATECMHKSDAISILNNAVDRPCYFT